MGIIGGEYCVYLTDRSKHDTLFPHIRTAFEIFSPKICLIEHVLDGNVENAVAEFFDTLPFNCKSVHVDPSVESFVHKYVDCFDDSVVVTEKLNLIVNSCGIKTAFNTDVLAVNTIIDRVCSVSNRVACFDNVVVAGNDSLVIASVTATTNYAPNKIHVLAENHAGKNNSFSIASRKGLPVYPLPYVAPNIVGDFLENADLVVSSLPVLENNYWSEIFKFKTNSVYVELGNTCDSPSLLFVNAVNNGAFTISGFTMLMCRVFAQFSFILNNAVEFADFIDTFKRFMTDS